jgi:large subunit ribosomal protein L10
MDREQKRAEVAGIQDRFERMASAVLTDFRGLNVESMTELRDEFRKLGVEYRIVKNTLFDLAVKEQPYREQLTGHLVGPTGVAWSYDDPAAPAKVAVGFAKDHEQLKIKCAVLEGEVLEGAKVVELSKMPSKDELLGTLLATFIAPAQEFVRLIAAAPTNFACLLDARRRQLEEK